MPDRGFQPTPSQFQLESDSAYNPWLRAAGVGVTGTALYGAHRYMLATRPEYAQTLYRYAKNFEDYSPMHLGRTFAVSERMSVYTTPEEVAFTRDQLLSEDGTLNTLGKTFQRQFDSVQPGFDVLEQVTEDKPLRYRGRRTPGAAHMQLVDRPGFDFETMMVPADGRLAGTASRYGQDLSSPSIKRSKSPNMRTRLWEDFQNVRASQRISNRSGIEVEEGGLRFRPFHTKAHVEEPLEDFGRALRGVKARVGVESLELTERLQRLVGEVGVGLKPTEWNKAWHVPLVGEGGMVNQMLTRRVLPIALGVTALGWLDYHLGHPSDKAIDLGLKANVLRADLTDMAPGGRGVTDFYAKTVPGPQYGPLALPAAGAFAGALWHYSNVLRGNLPDETIRKAAARLFPDVKTITGLRKEGTNLLSSKGLGKLWGELGAPGKGAAIGLAVMLPFIPGMLGSRKTGNDLRDVYSGDEPVAIRSGRWWEVGSTPAEGTRIKAWRPHWSVLHKARAEDISLYGSEAEKWKHNPFTHPVRWLRNPYWLEEQHFADRPYPVTSPAFSNVPLIGPLLAATIGKVVKPVVRMHEQEWSGDEYTLYSTRLEPKGSGSLPPPKPKDEFSIGRALKQEVTIFKEYTGAMGFFAGAGWDALFPDRNQGQDVYFQGSRQMSNLSRRYYEREMGAGMGPSPTLKEAFGYSEPLRRFIQRESFEPQANEVANTMPSWLPGDDYMTNFKVGDPFVKVDDGYARLPGAGYEAIHPELKGLDAEDYPDLYKLRILSDVAPYSREYNTFRQKVAGEARQDTQLQIELDKIVDRVRQTKESSIRMDERRFTLPVDTIEGTVDGVSPGGVRLKEYPGRVFHFSSVGMSAADLSARILGENNKLTREEVAGAVDQRRANMFQWLSDNVSIGGQARLTVPKGAAENAESIRAVIEVDGQNINRELIEQGFGEYREDLGGAESREMHGSFGQIVGSAAEALSFQGDSSALNPMRYIPVPGHTKLWQERTAYAQYLSSEVVGTRMRRWERPIHDFLFPYVRGGIQRLTGHAVVPEDVQARRDLNTLADTLRYLRGLNDASRGDHTRKERRTSVGADLFASPIFVASTLPAREAPYFREFLHETDPDKRASILDVASPEMSRALSAQWTGQQARIAAAEGESAGPVGENGRPYDKASVEEYKQSDTRLGYGDWLRSKEVADFFSRTGFALPEGDSPVLDDTLDYEDVKLKLIQQEGYDAHDFNIFDDRAALLWRKPYVDGAVRELTAGDTSRSAEQLRQSVEQMILAGQDRNPDVRSVIHTSPVNRASVRIDASIDQTGALLKDIRRNPDKYKDD